MKHMWHNMARSVHRAEPGGVMRKKAANRKRANKRSVYLDDVTRQILTEAEAATGRNWSQLIRHAVAAQTRAQAEREGAALKEVDSDVLRIF